MKLQVLIADADPDFQRTMTQALSREGDMEAAGVSSDGLETLSLIQTARPDVVLLDLIQQRLDGLAILRRLAGREDAPPVLVLTGFVNAAVVAECAKLGAAYFIPKPCDPGALLQCLRQGSTRRRKRDRPPPSPDWPPRRRCRLPRPHIWKAPSPTFSTRWAYRRILKAFNTCVQGSFLRSAVRAPSPE